MADVSRHLIRFSLACRGRTRGSVATIMPSIQAWPRGLPRLRHDCGSLLRQHVSHQEQPIASVNQARNATPRRRIQSGHRNPRVMPARAIASISRYPLSERYPQTSHGPERYTPSTRSRKVRTARLKASGRSMLTMWAAPGIVWRVALGMPALSRCAPAMTSG